MKKPTDVGGNVTGVASALPRARRAIDAADEGTPPAAVRSGSEELRGERMDRSTHAEPIGTMPEPPHEEPSIYLDLLGARLAFERTGVRLYEALLVKLDAAHVHEGGPTREEVERIRDAELEHFGMLLRILDQLGADPTAMTPSADVAGVTASGVLQVVTDPRTTLTQALEAMLVAELADSDGWLLLADLAERLDMLETADEFRDALATEEEHVALLRRWLRATVTGQAGVAATPRLLDEDQGPGMRS